MSKGTGGQVGRKVNNGKYVGRQVGRQVNR